MTGIIRHRSASIFMILQFAIDYCSMWINKWANRKRVVCVLRRVLCVRGVIRKSCFEFHTINLKKKTVYFVGEEEEKGFVPVIIKSRRYNRYRFNLLAAGYVYVKPPRIQLSSIGAKIVLNEYQMVIVLWISFAIRLNLLKMGNNSMLIKYRQCNYFQMIDITNGPQFSLFHWIFNIEYSFTFHLIPSKLLKLNSFMVVNCIECVKK